MRARRCHPVVVLALCWAQVAVILTGPGFVQRCLDGDGASHFEVGIQLCAAAPSDGTDRTAASFVGVESRSSCACGPCDHAPLSDIRAVVRASSARVDRDFPDLFPLPVLHPFASTPAGMQARVRRRATPLCGLPPDRAVSLCSVMLII